MFRDSLDTFQILFHNLNHFLEFFQKYILVPFLVQNSTILVQNIGENIYFRFGSKNGRIYIKMCHNISEKCRGHV